MSKDYLKTYDFKPILSKGNWLYLKIKNMKYKRLNLYLNSLQLSKQIHTNI